jgi:hypothetical protein
LVKDAKKAPGLPVPFDKLAIPSQAHIASTLGNFITHASGQLIANFETRDQNNRFKWYASGTMYAEDVYDFNKFDWGQGSPRPVGGEIKTRVGGYVNWGDSFPIRSNDYKFNQDENMRRMAVANQGELNPVSLPDNFSRTPGVNYVLLGVHEVSKKLK